MWPFLFDLLCDDLLGGGGGGGGDVDVGVGFLHFRFCAIDLFQKFVIAVERLQEIIKWT